MWQETDGILGMEKVSQPGSPAGITAVLWKGKDLLSGREWEDVSGETGYLYQVLIQLVDRDGCKVSEDDQEVKVQIQGDGQLAGIDNGDLADVTPFSSERRKTCRGDLAVYVRRTGKGGIRVFLQPFIDKKPGEPVSLVLNGLTFGSNLNNPAGK